MMALTGSDGLLIEIHLDPDHAKSDGARSLDFPGLPETVRLAAAPGRIVGTGVEFVREKPMTESEWRLGADPARMLEFTGERATERVRRRFICACCRRVEDLLGKWGRKSVRAGEMWAEGLLEAASLRRALTRAAAEETSTAELVYRKQWSMRWLAQRRARGAVIALTTAGADDAARDTALAWAIRVTRPNAVDQVLSVYPGANGLRIDFRPQAHGARDKRAEFAALLHRGEELEDAWWTERQIQADMLRCLLPWDGEIVFDDRWRTPNVMGLARSAQEDGEFDRLPILADALMEAGCNHETILAHCRSEVPHVRGCWVIDWILESGR